MTLQAPDIVPATYWARWSNSFPADDSFFPIGVFPTDESPASLQAMGINFATPARDATNGVWRPDPAYVEQVQALQPGFSFGGAGTYRCLPSLSAASQITNGPLTLPAATIAVSNITPFAQADALSTKVGQFTVTSSAGPQVVSYSGISGNSFTGCTGGTGTVANGANVTGADWGRAYAFQVFGDEMESNDSYFDGIPAELISIIDANHVQLEGTTVLSAAGFKAASDYLRSKDPTRPVYNQFTGMLADPGDAAWHWGMADRELFCSTSDIISFDVYPLVMGKGPVWHQGECVAFIRSEAKYARPVFPFVETGQFYGGVRAPTPAETVAEVWSSIINGAAGIQYFDGAGGGWITTPGPMHDAIAAVNARIARLAPIINDSFAQGYVATDQDASMQVMAKLHGGVFTIFAMPSATGPRTVTFTLAGAPSTTITVLDEGRTLTVTDGVFTDGFASELTVHIYQVAE